MKSRQLVFVAVCLVSAPLACAKVSGSGGSGGATGTGARPVLGGEGTGSVGGLDASFDQGPVEKFVAADATGMCKPIEYMFAPKIPTVTLLVDRSGSMYHCLSGSTGDVLCSDPANTSWNNLRVAIESVMTQLESQVRFAFSTVAGTNPTGGGSCPSLQGMTTDAVPPALNNASAIAKVYDALPPPPNSTQAGMKFESPASESIAVAAKALTDDPNPGDKYIIFLTDGQPDYCDDSNSLCAPDSVVYQIQNAFKAGIRTIVFGVQTPLFDLAPGVLQAFANAGAGEPTIAPVRVGGMPVDLWDQCNGLPPWAADLTASGKPKVRGTTLGTYDTTMGPTVPYTPSASNQTQLVSQLSAALSGVKSCTFDLKDASSKPLKVDRTMLNLAHIKIMGTDIPLDDTNGWHMSTDSQLELNGTACETWHAPATTTIKFDFPCEVFIIG